MKRIVTSLLIGSLIWMSCKKENQAVIDQQLIGQWKWKSYQIGSPSNTLTPQNTGVQENLVFNSNLTWSKTQNGTTTSNGTYIISIIKSSNGETVNTLNLGNIKSGTDTTAYYKIYNDTTLVFAHDLIGTTGSASRTYVKNK